MARLRRFVSYGVLFFLLAAVDVWMLSYFYRQSPGTEEALLEAVWEDIVYFPVPQSAYDKERFGVTFADSWMDSRRFGGERTHEGCDIMASLNERGRYPVVSMSDGYIEKMGWLKLGGYRIGVRSTRGVYFYYAHLSDYAPELSIGDEVKAGELLGFMGDTGYSEVEGTTGYFPVHLHVGIYLEGEDGEEKSYNPYPFLRKLEEKKLTYWICD